MQKELENVNIKRGFMPINFGCIEKGSLHYFLEATKVVTVKQTTYLYWMTVAKVHCSLVMKKSYIEPIVPYFTNQKKGTCCCNNISKTSILVKR